MTIKRNVVPLVASFLSRCEDEPNRSFRCVHLKRISVVKPRVALLFAAFLFVAHAVQAEPVLDQNNVYPLPIIDGLEMSSSYVQTFTVGISGELVRVDLQIARLESTTRTLSVSILRDGNVLATVDIVPSPGDPIFAPFGIVSVDFSAFSIAVTAGETLGISIPSAGSLPNTCEEWCWAASFSDPYPGGNLIQEGMPNLATDMGFATYVETTKPIQTSFSATVTSVDAPLAGTFSVGDSISGSYTFDPTISDFNSDPNFGVYFAVNQFEALVGGYLASATGNNINVNNDLGGKDEYQVIAKPPSLVAAPVDGLEISMLLLELTDETTSAFSNDSLPPFVDLSDFGTARVVLRFGDSPNYAFVIAKLNELIPAQDENFVQGECGQTIFASVTMTQSIGPCPGDGIVIGSDNILVEADGHTISGIGTGDGIQIFGRSNVVVRHAFISGFDIGVHVLGGDGITIEESQLTANNRAVVIETNGNHVVTRNVIRDNGVGVVLNAPNNFVYHNIIWNNAQQIQDTGGNFWVDPDAGLGNYWSNYWGDDDGSLGRPHGDFIGDTRLPHEGVDTSPLLNPSYIGTLLCDDWWGSLTARLVWRGGWSPVTIRITDNQGRVLSADVNELGKDGFYTEDDTIVPGSTLVHALILPCTKYYPVDGTYGFEMTALDDLDYTMEWFVGTQGGGADLYRSVENVVMGAGEVQEVVTQLVTLDDQGQGNFTFAADALVDIDVKPNDATNAVNLSSAGVIPVAILSSPTFDATTVMPDSVAMSGSAVKLVGKGTNYLCSISDENGDGLNDLMCKIETEQMQLESGTTTAVLTAVTMDGLPIRGTDSLTIVKDAM